MVEENPLTWEIEPNDNYLNSHMLYRGIKKFLWSQWEDLNKIYPNFFSKKQAEGGLSVDWSKYANPLDSLKLLPEPSQEKYGICQINVGDLIQCIALHKFPIEIKHDPIKNEKPFNRAHTLLINILNENIALIKKKLSGIADWAPEMKPKQ